MSDDTTTPNIRRVRVACKACNARRVKCDASDGQPCWHCRTRHTPCELIESKRGKYPRRGRGERRISRRLQGSRDPSIGVAQASLEDITPDANSPDVSCQTNDTRETIAEESQVLPATDQPNPRQSSQDNIRSYYLGDSSSFSYIIEMICSPRSGVTEPVKVHYPIPASIADRTIPFGRLQARPATLEEALTFPAQHVADRLVYEFFKLVHPTFPVLNRRSFTQLYRQGKISPIVLQTVFLLGVTVCGDDLLREAGFNDRVTARRTHYLRAKTLYDIDYETDRTDLASALMLLSFWWNSPDDQKDSWYWLGCATSYAQSLGMHRSSTYSVLDQETRSLWKRIWWSVFIRDRHTAACFGRPCRVRDEDCDVEPMTEEDLTFDQGFDETLVPTQKDYHVSYILEMAKLSEILGDIIIGEFSPRRPALERYDTEDIEQRLEQWESQLPEYLRQLPPDESLGASYWASMLQIAHQNYRILLFRPRTVDNESPEEAERDVKVRMAADSVTRMAEDLLAAGIMRISQIHLTPAVFGALSIHTMVICRKDPVRRQLAGNKSRQCILALSELAKTWPVGLWTMRFFVNLMGRLVGKGGSVVTGGSIVNSGSRVAGDNCDDPSSSMHNPSAQPRNHVHTGLGDGINCSHEGDGSNNQLPGTIADQRGGEFVPDQFNSDSFWAGCLDGTLDVDLLLHHGLGPLLPTPFIAPPDSLGL
ncbi:hypothetical protein FALBO_7111 [Fusarium albosuccineum]|uniref:Zn(2)-C6 fungal-type domain-containing protein n=1 Tax=Fusarium albosuccineum TaxID=1237068 RepID=A0A8H4LDM2_9HYPO|nr:hypothetical protein FALBO_7111 [Fusarium albosuccineum]